MRASVQSTPEADRSIASRSKEIVTGSVVLLGMVGTLLGAEAYLRFNEIVQFGKNQAVVETSSMFYVDSATGLRRLRPGAKSGQIAVNSFGFRGPEIAPRSEGNVVQIAFLGHSTTFDPYADEKRNWPYLVSKAIAADLPSCTVEFMNGGVPGYG